MYHDFISNEYLSQVECSQYLGRGPHGEGCEADVEATKCKALKDAQLDGDETAFGQQHQDTQTHQHQGHQAAGRYPGPTLPVTSCTTLAPFFQAKVSFQLWW